MPPPPQQLLIEMDKEWRQMLLEEVRGLRKESRDESRLLRNEFTEFKDKMIAESGERKGRQTVISLITSFAVSIVVGIIAKVKF